jgi:hypothetical protein
MNRFMKVGLLTALLSAAPITPIESVKPNLEVIAEQNTFISPDKNYSLKQDPRKYGLSRPSHVVYPMGGYKDTYHDIPNRFLVIECTEKSGDLDRLFDQYSAFYVQSVSETISKYLRPGRKIAKLPMSPKQHIIVDNHPAIRGSMEFMVTDSKGDKIMNAAQHYLQITVTQDKKNLYGFIFFNRIPEGDQMQAEVIYDVLDSFRALK